MIRKATLGWQELTPGCEQAGKAVMLLNVKTRHFSSAHLDAPSELLELQPRSCVHGENDYFFGLFQLG
jgi:hypothetical protein